MAADDEGWRLDVAEVSAVRPRDTFATDQLGVPLETVTPGNNLVVEFAAPGFAKNYETTQLISWETVPGLFSCWRPRRRKRRSNASSASSVVGN